MADRHPTAAQRWAPTIAAALLTAAFAACAFRLSYAALTALAVEHGVAADLAWMFAVVVDGGAVVGTVGVIAARRAARRTWPYWSTTAAFAAISLAFNVVHSDGSGIGVAVAVTPPVAQLVATELLVRMLPDTTAAAAPPPTLLADVDRAVADAAAAAAAARTAADQARAAAADAAALVDQARTTTDTDTGTDAADTVADTAADAGDAAPRPTPPAAAIAAYRRILAETGRRPTAAALGAALGLKRTRGSELRRMVEAALGTGPLAT